jgi:hypothetical protein
MLAPISTLFSWLACLISSRAELELELNALRHQVALIRSSGSSYADYYITQI